MLISEHQDVLTRQWWDLICSLLWTVHRHSAPAALIWALCGSDLEHNEGTFSLSDNTRQLLHSCLKFVWKSSRVKTAREKRPVAANSLSLQKSQEEEWAWQGGRGVCVCVVPSVARRCGGETVSRLDGGWIPASGAAGGGGPGHSSALTPSLRLGAAVK